MRPRRLSGVLSILAVVAAAGLVGASFSYFSNNQPNPLNDFAASPDFSNVPPQGASRVFTGFSDFSVGLSGTVPVAVGPGSLALDHVATGPASDPAGGGATAVAGGALGQTWTALGTGEVGGADLWLRSITPTAELTVSIRATSGGFPTGPPLVSAVIPPGAVGTTPGPVTVTFATPLATTVATLYTLVLEGDAVWQQSLPYVDGRAMTSPDGIAFGALPVDLAFAVRPSLGGPYLPLGTQTSDPLDLGSPPPDQYLSISWSATLAFNTAVTFQLAASNQATDTAASTFLGPDGTAATVYTVPASAIWSGLNGRRFLRYRAFLTTADSAATPVLSAVRVAWDHRPNPPTNLSPVSTITPTATFSWTATDADTRAPGDPLGAGTDVLTYLFQVSPTPTFAAPVEQRVRLRDPIYTLGAPLAPGAYFWRVASFDGVLQSDWSAVAAITVTASGGP